MSHENQSRLVAFVRLRKRLVRRKAERNRSYERENGKFGPHHRQRMVMMNGSPPI